MGARVSVASDQRPLGRAFAEFVTVDESGMETARDLVPSDPGLVLQVVHFVDIDAGGRVSTVALGDMSLSVPRDCTLDQLRDEVREFIFEDDLRDVDESLVEPRWEDMSSALRERGIIADEETLHVLPFVIELDDDIQIEFDH